MFTKKLLCLRSLSFLAIALALLPFAGSRTASAEAYSTAATASAPLPFSVPKLAQPISGSKVGERGTVQLAQNRGRRRAGRGGGRRVNRGAVRRLPRGGGRRAVRGPRRNYAVNNRALRHRRGYRKGYRRGYGKGYRRGYYRPYRRYGYYDPFAVGVVGLATGALIAGAVAAPRTVVVESPVPAPYTGEWYRRCSLKYRSFRASDGTYLTYRGVRRTCRLP